VAAEEGPGWSIFPLNHHIGLLEWLRPRRDKDRTEFYKTQNLPALRQQSVSGIGAELTPEPPG